MIALARIPNNHDSLMSLAIIFGVVLVLCALSYMNSGDG